MDANPHGNGLAWMDNVEGELCVHWRKGIKDEDAKNVVKSLGDTMVVFHARIATVGGVNGLLSHPFPITLNPRLQYHGLDDMVLFHNGHFAGWEKFVPEKSLKDHEFAWSDSRAIAHALASGQVTMEDLGKSVNGVFAVLSSKPFEGDKTVGTIERFGDWEKIEDTVWASNTNFMRRGSYTCWDFTKSGRGFRRLWDDDDDDSWMHGTAYYNYARNNGRSVTRPLNNNSNKPAGYSDVFDRHSYRYSG